MVVRKRKREHQAGREFLAAPYRPHRAARDAKNRHLRRVDDRRERGAADAAEARDRERAALHVAGLELAVARELADVGELLRDVEHALAVGVAHHRHHEAARRVDRDADVEVLLDDDALTRLVEDRKSTRLNSSHSQISYAVFCLKKKKKQRLIT